MVEMENNFWYYQTISMLTHCVEDLSYANQNDVLSNEELKAIDFKVRELCTMIPNFDKVHEILRDKRLGILKKRVE
jgi:hypothetical protein